MKKFSRLISILTAALILISSITVTAFAAEAITETTAIKSGRTYEIGSYRDLETLSVLVNENAYNCAGATFVLTNDIEINTADSDSKVLFMSFPDFRGTFNGNGHSIKGLYIKGCGLFESLTNATVTNLKLVDAYITMEDESSYPVGGIAGQINKSTISFCTFKGTVINGGDYTGGIAGRVLNGSKISNCKNHGVIFGKNYVGGIAGLADVKTTVERCFNYGATYGTGADKKGTLNFERTARDIQTGQCGSSVNYVLYNKTGLLVLSGTGATKDYVTAVSSSVFAGNEQVKYVIIEEGITTIGDFLFESCKNLEYILLPESLTTIGMGAFMECSSLREMKISDKITSIGEAHSSISKMLRVNISPYAGCTQMMSFDVDKSNQNYSIGENGELYNKDKTKLIGYPSGNVSKSFVVPETVIEFSMFAISSNEFLEELYIPKSVKKTSAYSICFCENLKNIYYDSTEENWEKLNSKNASLNAFYLPGTATVHCTVCEHEKTEKGETVEPTCRYEGYTVYKCVECGHKFHSDYVNALPHKFVYDESLTASTAHEEGEIMERCENCNVLRKVKIEKMLAGYNTDAEYISGLNAGTSVDSFNSELSTAGFASFEINSTDDALIGTSSNVIFTYDDGNVESYEVILFGDVNGDGWYDGQDAVTVNMIANGMLTREQVGDAAYKAADCNHDGVIDEKDVEILNRAGVLLASIDQSKSNEELVETSAAYGEYLCLIDQNEIPSQEPSDEPIEEPTNPAEESNLWNIVITFITNIIKYVFSGIKLW